MAMKYNPRTRRWESTANDFGADAETIKRMAGTTTTTTPRATPESSSSGRRAPEGARPRQSTTTTTAPRATTTTVPRQTTTTTRPTTTTTTPKKPTAASPRGGMGGPTAAQIAAGRYVGGPGFKTEEQGLVDEAAGGDFAGFDVAQLIAALQATAGDGGTPSWVPNPMAAAAGFDAARQQEAAGRAAQQQYGRLAQTGLNATLADIASRYGTQQSQSEEAIRNATAQFLQAIPQSTGFQQAQFMTLPQQQAALADLARYGGTGELAQAASAQDNAMAQAIQNIMQTSAGQLGQAESGYLDALRLAGQGGQTAALQGLQQQLTAGRSSEEAAARAAQQQLLAAGIEALMSGRQTAAQTRAATTAEYGRPRAKKKPKGKTKK